MKRSQPPKKLWEHPRKLLKIRHSVYETSAGAADPKKYWRAIVQKIEDRARRYESRPDPDVLKELFRNKGNEFFKAVFDTDEVDVTDRTLYISGNKKDPLKNISPTESRSFSDTSELEAFRVQFDSSKTKRSPFGSLGSCRSTFRRSRLDPEHISRLAAKLTGEDARLAPHSPGSDQSVDWLSTASVWSSPLKSSSTDNVVKRVRLANESLSGPSSVKKLKLSNPYYDMLRTNKSEDDMICWNSKYRPPQLISDDMAQELREKAKDRQKFQQIQNFMKANFTWKDEEDKEFLEQVEELFKIKFIKSPDTTVSFIAKELPSASENVAAYCGVPERSNTQTMKRLLNDGEAAYRGVDKKVAFGTSLPQNLRGIVRRRTNNPWNINRTPDDVKDMKLVFDGITNLEAVQRYYDFLKQRGLSVPNIMNQAYEHENVAPRRKRKLVSRRGK